MNMQNNTIIFVPRVISLDHNIIIVITDVTKSNANMALYAIRIILQRDSSLSVVEMVHRTTDKTIFISPGRYNI